MDSDAFITQEKARELVALLERARDLLHDSTSNRLNEYPDGWLDQEQAWQRDVKATLDN